ncbi:hypothetical protein Nmel_013218, partial [Mimus melanotis]
FCTLIFFKYNLLPCKLITDCLGPEATLRLGQVASGDRAKAAEQPESQPCLGLEAAPLPLPWFPSPWQPLQLPHHASMTVHLVFSGEPTQDSLVHPLSLW